MSQLDDDDNTTFLRQMFAGLALQGLLASNYFNPDLLCERAVQLADELIEELNKPKEGNHDQ